MNEIIKQQQQKTKDFVFIIMEEVESSLVQIFWYSSMYISLPLFYIRFERS